MGKVLVLDSKTLEFTEVEIEKRTVSLKDLRDSIGCDYVEHISGYNETLDKLHVGMWIDEEGKLKDGWFENSPLVIANKDRKIIEMLAGNILFATDGADGNTYCLSDEKIKMIKQELFDGTVCNGIDGFRKVKVLKYKG